MEFNKNVSNPMLIGSMELLKAEPTPEHQNMFITEMVKAQFLVPVMLTPEPAKDENGKIKVLPGSKMQFPMLSAQDGKVFMMAFTDKMEYEKWKGVEGKNVCTLSFDELAGILLSKDSQGNMSPALGYVINPFGANMVIPREMIGGLMATKLSKHGQSEPPTVEK